MNAHPLQRLHIVSALVENKAGVLARIASLFARRGFNIHSLAVAPTNDFDLSRVTIVVDLASAPLEQIVKQLDKLINVVRIEELKPTDAVERELMLLTVEKGDRPHDVLQTALRFGGYALDFDDGHITFSFSASPERLDECEELMQQFGITRIQRTGRVALPRLRNSDE
ncbi:MAG: acetolactate synthase small subunit [Actinomycetia bacterium]|nr:acetolactate synthase small subunit [Actinomycetes bacterium]